MQRGQDVTDRITGADGVNPYSQDPDLARVLAWAEVNREALDNSEWQRRYNATTDPGERLRLIGLRLDRKPGASAIPRHDPAVVTAAVVVGYLRGQFEAPDLEPAATVWPWPRICDLAETQGAGWDSFQDVDSARGALRVFRMRGYLDVPPPAADADAAILRFLSSLSTVNENPLGVSRTPNPTPGDASTAGRTRDGGGR